MTNALGKEARKASRNRCRIAVKVRYSRQEAVGRIIDISRIGLAIELSTHLCAGPGSTVNIEADEIGLLEGLVRWNYGGRMGIMFRPNSNSLAKIDAYFRNYHREYQPVLRR